MKKIICPDPIAVLLTSGLTVHVSLACLAQQDRVLKVFDEKGKPVYLGEPFVQAAMWIDEDEVAGVA